MARRRVLTLSWSLLEMGAARVSQEKGVFGVVVFKWATGALRLDD